MPDVKFVQNGCREYHHNGRTWTLVHRGRVGIMLSDSLTAKWREGGAHVVARGRADRRTTRCMSVLIPRKGRHRGMSLMAVYAPVSGRASAKERDKFRDEVRFVEQRSRGRTTSW